MKKQDLIEDWKNKNVIRLIEFGVIVGFLMVAFFLVGFQITNYNDVTVSDNSPSIEVYAYSMPNNGWAPLTVYFSPFGSNDAVGEIIRYEWDLDGNGSFETDATSAGGYASYTYTKPRDYIISLRVTNDKGISGLAYTHVQVRHPASSNVDYETVFDDSQVRRVEISISQENWNTMMQEPFEKTQVKADANIFGERIENIGISPKGNSTLSFSGDKKPFKLDMNAYIEEQEYRNLSMLLLHNNFGDASMLREKMAYDMMQFAGVAASHTAFVELWINISDDDLPSNFIGVYTMVERPDKKYLANRFGRENDTGNLYKADAWFEEGAADLAYYGEDINDYPMPRGELAYRLMYKEDGDYADIINLCYTIDGVTYDSSEEFASALEEVFNVDSYLRYLAVIFLNLNFDQYPDTGNNYYLYNNPGTQKFEWVAWDMGNSWGHFGGDATHPIFGTDHSMGPLEYRPLFTRVFEVEEYRQTYMAYLDLLVRYWFNEENVGAQARTWQTMIKQHLSQGNGDLMYYGPSAQATIEGFDNGVQEIIDLTGERADYVEKIIALSQ